MSQNQTFATAAATAAPGTRGANGARSTQGTQSFDHGRELSGAGTSPGGRFLRATAWTRSTGFRNGTTLVGRFLFSAIFLMSVAGHFKSATIAYAAHQGVPFAGFLVPASGLLALAGGLSVLLGYRARLGAWALVLFLVPVTLMLHNFWAVGDPMMRQMQMAMFMKNFSILGGALLISVTGAGPLSLDARSGARAGSKADRRDD